MRHKVPWLIYGISLLLLAASIPLWVALWRRNAADYLPQPLLVPGFGFVGAVITSRTRNAMGPLFLSYACFASLMTFVVQVTALLELRGWNITPTLGALWPATFLFFGLLLLLFPTGRAHNAFWRGVLAVHIAIWAVLIVDELLQSDLPPIFIAIGQLTLLASIPAPIARRRGANPALRSQLRWLAYTISLGVLALALAAVVSPFIPAVGGVAGVAVTLIATLGIPGAVGIAIKRDRLYDIDDLIERTLVYGVVILALTVCYVAIVLLIQAALDPFGESKLAVAASTLIVAGLFRPALTFVRSVVDRRFYRARFDARRTVEAFALRLRNEVDLETVADDLRDVVTATMQPASMSLWLRGP